MNIARRDFLGMGMGLVATAALPNFLEAATGKDTPLFGRYGKHERLSLASRRVHIGLSRPFSILHISDTHLTKAYDDEDAKLIKRANSRTKAFGGHQEQSLSASLAWAKDNVDYVIHTGDLVDFQSRANFDLAKKYFGSIGLAAPGNHDYSGKGSPFASRKEELEYRATRAKMIKDAWPKDPDFAASVVNGVNFIVMDDVFWTVTEKQVELFRKEAKKKLPMVLCMHVPIYTENIALASYKKWGSMNGRKLGALDMSKIADAGKRQMQDPLTGDFIRYLKSEPLLKAILTGHVHYFSEERFSPTAMQYTVAGNYMYSGQEILFT